LKKIIDENDIWNCKFPNESLNDITIFWSFLKKVPFLIVKCVLK
jgi:hypothetical protein